MFAARDDNGDLFFYTHHPINVGGSWISIGDTRGSESLVFRTLEEIGKIPFFDDLTSESDPWEFDFVRKEQ